MTVPNKFLCSDDIKEIQSLSPWLLVILADVILWASSRGLVVMITSLLRPDDDGISKSKTHQEGRAFDLSVRGWTEFQIKELCDYINSKYKDVGAISASTGESRCCYYHNSGHGWHFHIQVRPSIKGVSLCLFHS